MTPSESLSNQLGFNRAAYYVKAGGKQKLRYCAFSDIDLLDAAYAFYDRHDNGQGIPILIPLNDQQTFPYLPYEITEYGQQAHVYLEKLQYQELLNYFDFIFFESSTEFIVENGMPTKADVDRWIELIKKSNYTKDQKKKLVKLCKEY